MEQFFFVFVLETIFFQDKLANVEEKSRQLENENRQLKKEVSTSRRESIVDHSDNEIVEHLRKENNQIVVLKLAIA